MGDGFREIDLEDAEQGSIKLLHPLPRDGDPWGVLAPLRDTKWGSQIRVVSGEAYSHALHGWATPLARELGPEPRFCARRVDVICALHKSCMGYRPKVCRPGVELPDCYEPSDLEYPASMLAVRVAIAWKEGRYVVVVEGETFSLS